MNLPIQFTMQDIDRVRQNSPVLIDMAGRAFGLAGDEREALVRGKLPAWFWISLGVIAGTLIGIQAQKRVPRSIPKFMGGE